MNGRTNVENVRIDSNRLSSAIICYVIRGKVHQMGKALVVRYSLAFADITVIMRTRLI